MPKGYSQRNQGGWNHRKETIALMKKNRGDISNENNPRWKGDMVSYAALHNWVRNHFVKLDFCEHCLINPGLNTRGHNKLQWANKNKKYLRKRSDWICLCPSCHRKMDLKNKIKHKYGK